MAYEAETTGFEKEDCIGRGPMVAQHNGVAEYDIYINLVVF